MADLGKQIRMWANKQKLNVDKTIRATALDMSSQVVMKTPVKDGFARGSWQPTIVSPSRKGAGRADKTGAATIALISKAVVRAPGNVFYLVSNLSYIVPLEYGTYGRGPYATEKTNRTGFSIQAPGGMVRLTVHRFKRALKKALKNVT